MGVEEKEEDAALQRGITSGENDVSVVDGAGPVYNTKSKADSAFVELYTSRDSVVSNNNVHYKSLNSFINMGNFPSLSDLRSTVDLGDHESKGPVFFKGIRLLSEKKYPIKPTSDLVQGGCAMVTVHSLQGHGPQGSLNPGYECNECTLGSSEESGGVRGSRDDEWVLVKSVGLIRTKSGAGGGTNNKNNPCGCPGPKDEYSEVLRQNMLNRARGSRRRSDGDLQKNASMRHEFVLNSHRKRCFHFIRERIMCHIMDGVDRIKEIAFVHIMCDQELLAKLFCLFDQNHKSFLKQDEWIEFLKSRLNGEEKQIDFVEVVESVAYALYRDEDINFEKFCAIFRTKNVLNKLFRLIDKNQSDVITTKQVMDFLSQLTSTKNSSTRLTAENIKWLESVFKQHVGETGEIRKEDFKRIIQTKNQFFTERMFEIFDRDDSGSISLQEFLDQMNLFMGGDPDYKIKFLFECYDVDGDGLIQKYELEEVMTACMEENGMKFSSDQIRELTDALFDDADVNKTGTLTFEALKAQLEKHEGLLENLSVSIEHWLLPPKPKSYKSIMATKVQAMKPHQFSTAYMRNNFVYLIWLAAFLATNLALFLYRIFTYKNDHPSVNNYIVWARAAGQCLNFDCTFIVVLMFRRSLTFLRSHGFSSYIPIDSHIYLHQLTGWFVAMFAVLHTVMHMINIKVGIVPATNATYIGVMFDPNQTPAYGLIHGFAFNSGVFIFVILTVMVVCALPFVRRRGSFQVFYWTHSLYALFLILLIIHAPNFWKWFIVVGVILIVEQALRIYNWRSGHGRTTIRAGILLPSKVTHLTINRPPNFDFCPGDYVFVRIPKIAKYEWHPFTISSAPEQHDFISLHIRGIGNWTNRVHEYFNQQPVSKSEEPLTKTNSIAVQPAYQNIDEKPLKTIHPHMLPLASIESVSTGPLTSESSHSPHESTVIDSSVEQGTWMSSILPLECTKPQLSRSHTVADVHSKPRDITQHEKSAKQAKFHRSLSEVPKNDHVADNKDSGHDRDRAGSWGAERYMESTNRYMRNKPRMITFGEDSDDEMKEHLMEEGRAKGVAPDKKFHSFEVTSSTVQDGVLNRRSLEIYVDGPYGAPSSHIFRAQHAVLVATGIGVTPFASILQSIMLRYRATRQTCPNCEYSWCADIPQSVFNLKKVDFLWINREQRSFEWFVHLLSQLEIDQAELGGAMERFLDMHMYITSALQRTDMKAVGLQLALDLLHKKDKRDMITGLKTRTNAGRPNWNKVFKQLKDQNKGKITVFYCGPPELARTLKMKCDDFGFNFRKELF